MASRRHRSHATGSQVAAATFPQTQAQLSWITEAAFLLSNTRKRWFEPVLIAVLLSTATIFTGHNMFHYPHYELDEGTYVGSAWTMMSSGRLFYYTYTYSHPPLGWLQIGLWATLTGGFDRFGISVNSGRAFMLTLTVLSTLMVYLIVRRNTNRSSAGALGALMFAVSPLAVSLHRQVYLDNIGTAWLLFSVLLLQSARGRLSRVIASAVAFGIAFWSKEVFVAFAPAMFYLVFALTERIQRRFALVLWTMTSASLASLFVLLALLKDELLPPGVLWSSPNPHVSLIGTYFLQAGRGGGGLLDRHGVFWHNAGLWFANDPFLVVGGAIACAFGLVAWRWDKLTFGVALMAVCFVLFLGRGGIVIYYYVIPLLALAGLLIGLVTGHLINFVTRLRPLRLAVPSFVAALAILLSDGAISRNQLNFRIDATDGQVAAAKWLDQNISHSSIVIMDSYAWQDLRDITFTDGAPFSRANYYWPTLSDPTLRERLLNDNWQKIDYLLISSNTVADATSANLPLLSEAMSRSDMIASFNSGQWPQWIYRIRKLHHMPATDDPMLSESWKSYKSDLMLPNGGGKRVVDHTTGRTSSVDQAAAMMMAIYANDQVTFDALWRWAHANLQVRDDALLARSWGDLPDGTTGVLDRNTMTEADQDAALALLFAAKRWGDPDRAYTNSALVMLDSMWDTETVPIGSGRMPVAGDWARGDRPPLTGPVISLGALAPYAYRIFAQADPSHDWTQLVDSTYETLDILHSTRNFGGSTGLVPAYVKLDPKTGDPRLVGDTMPGANDFTAGASHLLWRLAIDYLWFGDQRAKVEIGRLNYLKERLLLPNPNAKDLLGVVASSYALDGQPLQNEESTELYAAMVPSLLVTDDANLDLASRAFAEKLLRGYHGDSQHTYWGDDARDQAAQSWAWMSAAVMDGAVSNIWAGETLIDWDTAVPQH